MDRISHIRERYEDDGEDKSWMTENPSMVLHDIWDLLDRIKRLEGQNEVYSNLVEQLPVSLKDIISEEDYFKWFKGTG